MVVVLTRELCLRVKGSVQVGGRIVLVRLETELKDTVIIQVYMPITERKRWRECTGN